jgi:hypothetical protein
VLNRMPPRLRSFVRHTAFATLGYLSVIGAGALYKGAHPQWPILVGFLGGAALAALTREPWL